MVNTGKTLLHVGCGATPLFDWIKGYTETRVDVDESVNPDIVASMTDLGDIGEYDMVMCCHALEHLHPADGDVALQELKRATKQGGCVLLFVPDLEDIKPTTDMVYMCPSGPITGLDMIYGQIDTTRDNEWMRHKTGFVSDTLQAVMERAGFSRVEVKRLPDVHSLMGVGIK